MNLLIVDDVPENLRLLEAVLTAEGHVVTKAADGVEALALLGAQPFDAVISDILMPRMDGYRLCAEVRKAQAIKHLPFIVYTATYTSPGDEKLALEMGADKYIRKPSSAAVLAQALSEMLMLERDRHCNRPAPMPEPELLKEYSELLVAKLEQKNIELAATLDELRDSQERLRQSQKMEIIGQFAGGIAHDFNNLLTVIHGFSQMLSEPEESPGDATRIADQIMLASDRAAVLTKRLLMFGRRQATHHETLDLNEVVEKLSVMIYRLVGEHIRFEIVRHREPLIVWADSGMLDQMLLNLVVNARDAMPAGGKLVIQLTAQPREGAPAGEDAEWDACVRVSDTGCGIQPADRNRIFDPFFTTKEAGKGTGLGLATVSGIVSQHHGSIGVESTVGAGSTFEVLLPLSRMPAMQVAPATEPAARSAAGQETVLVVEDDDAVRSLVRLVLERSGYHVIEALHGDDALHVWWQHGHDIQLVLSDMVMPGTITGRELADRLQLCRPEIPFIFTSGYDTQSTRDLLLSPRRHFLPKPLNARELLTTVRRMLDEAGVVAIH